MTRKKLFFPAVLAGLFILLILLTIPKGFFYGSYTDWLSQHVRLAETIRNACIEQHTIAPAFLPLGGGSNGYQFSYYGYLRPDILIGCLFPSIPMVYFVIGYMLTGYFGSVLLCYYWLISHNIEKSTAFLGSVLFLTAACFFHTHRQIMFVNYMPFLILALLAIRKKRFGYLPLVLLLIYVNSFYYSISCLVVIGWYWLAQEGKAFWKNGFFRYLKATFLSIGMAAVLLIPTALVILEHRRASESLGLPQMCGVTLNLQSILYSPYGMGLTAICFYTLLLGLTCKKYKRDSIFLLIMSTWCLAAWVLNGTLYARSKILIPFVPLIILHCARILSALWQKESARTELKWKLWPCILIAAVLPFWYSCKNFRFIAADIGMLTLVIIIQKLKRKDISSQAKLLFSQFLLCLMPCLLFLQTLQKEDFVEKKEVFAQETALGDNNTRGLDSLYRYDSLVNVLNTANLTENSTLQKSAMYSSITNKDYSDVYYNTFLSPIQINNKLAVLPSANPFLLNFLGIRYLETTADNIPAGYQVANSGKEQSKTVLVENKNVLPIAYATSSTISESQFLALCEYDRLDAITRYTVVPDDPSMDLNKDSIKNSNNFSNSSLKMNSNGNSNEDNNLYNQAEGMTRFVPASEEKGLPDSIQISKTEVGYQLNVKKETDVTFHLNQPLKNQILLLDFDVINQGKEAVVIDINNMRNKLSGNSAPYPNGNDTFHYQFSDSSGKGLKSLKVTFSKGKYLLKDMNWYTYNQKLLTQKQYTTVKSRKTKGNEILSCTVHSKQDGYFATSIPFQKGMEIFIDGKNVPILKLNQAFAGATLGKGEHNIQVTFQAPGQKAGYIISIISLLIYLLCTGHTGLAYILHNKFKIHTTAAK